MFPPSLTTLSPLHTHTRHLKPGFWSSPKEALQSNSSKKEGEGEKNVDCWTFYRKSHLLISGSDISILVTEKSAASVFVGYFTSKIGKRQTYAANFISD
jgi:hypothetical protein